MLLRQRTRTSLFLGWDLTFSNPFSLLDGDFLSLSLIICAFHFAPSKQTTEQVLVGFLASAAQFERTYAPGTCGGGESACFLSQSGESLGILFYHQPNLWNLFLFFVIYCYFCLFLFYNCGLTVFPFSALGQPSYCCYCI